MRSSKSSSTEQQQQKTNPAPAPELNEKVKGGISIIAKY
jgi:hypothetical protein